MSLSYSEHKERIIRSLHLMQKDGWKRVINFRTELCTVFVGAQHPECGYQGMITDRRQGRPVEFDAGQLALMQSFGWYRPESGLVRAFHRDWPFLAYEQVADCILRTLIGVFGWCEDEPLWIHLTYLRKASRTLDVDPLLGEMDKFTVVFIKPNVFLRQSQAWSQCTSAFQERKCDVVLHVPRGRYGSLSRFHGAGKLDAPPSPKCSINYFMHPEAPSPDWLAQYGRPS